MKLLLALAMYLPLATFAQSTLIIENDTGVQRFPVSNLEGADIAPVLGIEKGFRIELEGLPEDAFVTYRRRFTAFRTDADDKLVRVDSQPSVATKWQPAGQPLRLTNEQISEVPPTVDQEVRGPNPSADLMVYPSALEIRVEYHHREPQILSIPVFIGC